MGHITGDMDRKESFKERESSMTKTRIYLAIIAGAVAAIVAGCGPTYRYGMQLKAYSISPVMNDSPGSVLRFDIDTLVGPGRQARIYVTNTGSEPLMLHRKFTNLSRRDTVISAAPFNEDPYTELSFSQSASSTYSSSASSSGVNPYAVALSKLTTGSSQSTGLGVSSGTIVTRKPVNETILFPRQVLALELDDLASTVIASKVNFTYKDSYGKVSKSAIDLTTSSNDSVYIRKGMTAIRDSFVDYGKQTHTLFLVYSDIPGANLRTAQYSFNFSDLEVSMSTTLVE